MEELIKTFHIDWKLIIAQAVNFAIVIGVLWFFALKPLIQKMTKRTEAIEKGLKDARQAEGKLEEITALKRKELAEARREAEKIFEEAKRNAETERASILARAKSETEKIVKEAKEQIAFEKDRAMNEMKDEVKGLAVRIAEKTLAEVLDEKKDKELVKRAAEKISIAS